MAKYPYLKDMYPQLAFAHFRPVLPRYSEWSHIAQAAISSALSGQASPQAALDAAAKNSAPFFQKQ